MPPRLRENRTRPPSRATFLLSSMTLGMKEGAMLRLFYSLCLPVGAESPGSADPCVYSKYCFMSIT